MLFLPGMKAQEPYFRLKDLSNQWKEYGDLKGNNLTVIDFWATWCQPCVQSIPHLNEMASRICRAGCRFYRGLHRWTQKPVKDCPFYSDQWV